MTIKLTFSIPSKKPGNIDISLQFNTIVSITQQNHQGIFAYHFIMLKYKGGNSNKQTQKHFKARK